MTPLAELLRRLVAIPSPNPPGDCRAIASFCAGYLRAAGFDAIEAAPDNRAWSVVASIGPRRNGDNGGNVNLAEGPSLLYHAHIDTVPLGQNARWTHDPFGGEIEEGRLYGLGSVDDKGPLAAMLLAGAELAPRRDALCGRLTIVCAGEEEVGGRLGTLWLAEQGLLPPSDFVVVGEQTHNRVAIAHKGVLRAAFHVGGATAHATEPWRGRNAINGMAHLILALERYQAEVLDRRSHPLVGKPSINVGVIEGGVSANVVADACTIRVDRRMIPGEDPQAVIAELEQIAAAANATDATRSYRVDSFQVSNWFAADPQLPYVRRFLTLAAAETGAPPEPIGYLPGSDAKHLVTVAQKGMVVFGPGTHHVAHASDEYVDLGELEQTHRILRRFAEQTLLWGEGPPL
jgi:acetylornithine deacetylase/succinyl-diaminopimelate desuccinylase family protein